jgi:hypothetical protein
MTLGLLIGLCIGGLIGGYLGFVFAAVINVNEEQR